MDCLYWFDKNKIVIVDVILVMCNMNYWEFY